MRILFPLQGVHRGRVTSEQPAMTCPNSNNVRPFDTLDNRTRGGQRLPLAKKYTQQIRAEFPIVAICSVTTIN